jgi:hypothetical protein
MEDHERERLEAILEAITLTQNPRQVEAEIADLTRLGEQALAVERAGAEAKLGRLQRLLQEEGFFDDPDQRLLIFTEFKDTLDYLVQALTSWGFRVGVIHGGMKPGSREEPGTRLHAEQQFKDGGIQMLVATEAAGEGINLQVCHILVNFDIPWNPNRLEQRMGRIHRYGQTKDCLIFNFVATNTIEGRVLQKLLQPFRQEEHACVWPSMRSRTVVSVPIAGAVGDPAARPGGPGAGCGGGCSWGEGATRTVPRGEARRVQPPRGLARGCKTSMAQATSRRSPNQLGHAVRAWRRSPCASCRALRAWTGSAGTAAGGGTSGSRRPSGRWNRSAPSGWRSTR